MNQISLRYFSKWQDEIYKMGENFPQSITKLIYSCGEVFVWLVNKFCIIG